MAERKAFLLRIDPRLHDALKRWAEDEFRSLNAQAEVALRDALRRAGRLAKEESAASKQKPTPPPASLDDSSGSD